MPSLCEDPVCMVLSVSQNCEIWNIAKRKMLQEYQNEAFRRVDFCIGIPSHGIFVFTTYSEENHPPMIQIWSAQYKGAQCKGDCGSEEFENRPIAVIKMGDSEKQTVSSIIHSDNYLVTAHSGCCIQLRCLDNLVHDHYPPSIQNVEKLFVKKHTECSNSSLRQKDPYLVYELRGHKEPVYAMAVWKQENFPQLLVSGSGDGTLRVWDLNACQNSRSIVIRGCLRVLRGHTGYIYSLAIMSESNLRTGCKTPLLLSGGVDSLLHVWDLRDILYDLNWSRRRNFCLFLCIFNLLDRSYTTASDAKGAKYGKLRKISLGLQPSLSSQDKIIQNLSITKSSFFKIQDKYQTRGKRCRVYSYAEEQMLKRLREQAQTDHEISKEFDLTSIMTFDTKVEKRSTKIDIWNHLEIQSSKQQSLRSCEKLFSATTNVSMTSKAISAVFQSQHLCSIVASYI